MFGDFFCGCGNNWSSAYSWEGMGQQCQDCKTMILPINLRPLCPSSSSNLGPPHMQEYCEMCQRLGYNCRDFSPSDSDDAESVVSTISTVSSNNLTESDNEELSGSDAEYELA